jgi:GNAT superfamily N-acetyltransferase
MTDHIETSEAVASELDVAVATLHDTALLAPLFDAYRQFYGAAPDIVGAERFLAARLARKESIILVARCESLVGFAQLYPCFSSVAMRRTFVLNDLFVASEWRGHGVGRRLIGAAAELARRAGALALEIATRHDNHTALGLYESAGFVRDTAFAHLTLTLEI